MSESEVRRSDDLSEVERLQMQLRDAAAKIIEQETELCRLTAAAIVYATVISSDHQVIPDRFCQGDQIQVLDEELETFRGRVGTIISDGVDDSGTIRCEFFGIKNRPHLKVGINGEKSQVRLMMKNDGTNIICSHDNKVMEVWNNHCFDPKPGDTAKVHIHTNQVVEITVPQEYGELCPVLEVHGDQLEVEVEGRKRLIRNPIPEVEVGDRVVTDTFGAIAVRRISMQDTNRYKMKDLAAVSWGDIGGHEEVKEEIRECIFLPQEKPEIYEAYHLDQNSGFLFFGPPGCGKTLLGKGIAAELARRHGTDAMMSAFIYVKGPELLSKWVGESEAMSRSLFARLRKHYELHGYPGVLYVDECDAIFGERGSQHSQRWHDTLVAQWLAEMDGFDRTCGILALATNRPKSLDGALVREGRIDRHIKVPRPKQTEAVDIFKIHLDQTPLRGTEIEEVAGEVSGKLFSGEHPLYHVQEKGGDRKELFTLSDCVSGSLIKGICDQAKSLAIRRDMNGNGENVGVQMEDFQVSLERLYVRHRDGVNHRFDLLDFCEVRGLKENQVTVERVTALE